MKATEELVEVFISAAENEGISGHDLPPPEVAIALDAVFAQVTSDAEARATRAEANLYDIGEELNRIGIPDVPGSAEVGRIREVERILKAQHDALVSLLAAVDVYVRDGFEALNAAQEQARRALEWRAP